LSLFYRYIKECSWRYGSIWAARVQSTNLCWGFEWRWVRKCHFELYNKITRNSSISNRSRALSFMQQRKYSLV